MEHKEHQMVPIWFFIGILLGLYGLVITVTGIVHWKVPSGKDFDVMRQLHADVWWGALMLVLGVFYTVKFRPGKVEAEAAKEEEAVVQTRFE